MTTQTHSNTFRPIEDSSDTVSSPPTAAFAPPAPSLGPPGPPSWPPVARPRRRAWPWIVAGVAITALVVGGLVVIDQTLLTHDLLSADFNSGAAPFLEGASDEYEYEATDGMYAITATIDDPEFISPFAWFARTAASVEVSADVVAVHDPRAEAIVGLSCMDEPKGNSHGYGFLMNPMGYAIVRWDQDGNELLASKDLSTTWDMPFRMQINCASTGSSVAITGLVDGVETLSTVDENGLGTFRTAGFEFKAWNVGDSVAFDNVTAVVPGE